MIKDYVRIPGRVRQLLKLTKADFYKRDELYTISHTDLDPDVILSRLKDVSLKKKF